MEKLHQPSKPIPRSFRNNEMYTKTTQDNYSKFRRQQCRWQVGHKGTQKDTAVKLSGTKWILMQDESKRAQGIFHLSKPTAYEQSKASNAETFWVHWAVPSVPFNAVIHLCSATCSTVVTKRTHRINTISRETALKQGPGKYPDERCQRPSVYFSPWSITLFCRIMQPTSPS